jgi:hypothetical protein
MWDLLPKPDCRLKQVNSGLQIGRHHFRYMSGELALWCSQQLLDAINVTDCALKVNANQSGSRVIESAPRWAFQATNVRIHTEFPHEILSNGRVRLFGKKRWPSGLSLQRSPSHGKMAFECIGSDADRPK